MKDRKRWTIALTAVCLLLVSGSAFAQEHPTVPGKSMMELFEATGWVGWLMVVCSVVGTTLFFEHIVNLRRSKLAPETLADELEALINEEEYDEAIQLCEEQPCYLSNVIRSALTMRHAGYEEIIAGLEAAATEETLKLNTHISYLSLLGNIAPLLGLLGTVTGMISSFQVIETLKAPTPKDLAVGVYESLVNTTMGLALALLFLTMYFFYKNFVSKTTLSINLQAVEMLKHLAVADHGPAAKTAAEPRREKATHV